MTEFTGERVVPGQVEDDLWAEHTSRYAFARRLAAGRKALDIGCGTGYGTAELARVAGFAAGLDVATEAVEYANIHYPGSHFLRGSATALPFAGASFSLVTAFEVIEHLADWRTLLAEAARVLAPDGIFLVSTPNKLYYAESRAEHGPNPYHQHEFEYADFRAALTDTFRYTTIFVQNRLEAFAFYPSDHYAAAEASIETASGAAADAHFFVAICSHEPFTEPAALLHVPSATNLLRERETHIRLLQAELAQNQQWLADTIADRENLLRQHAGLEEHLDKQNQWARELEQHARQHAERILQLQSELEQSTQGYERQIAALDRENQAKTQWALGTEERLSAELDLLATQHSATLRLLEQSEATALERTQWAQRLEAQLRAEFVKTAAIRQSRWVRLGRTFRVGPDLNGDPRGGAAATTKKSE